MSVHALRPIAITPELFLPYGQMIVPESDGVQFGPQDAQLKLDAGTPRFYIMRLQNRGQKFHLMTRHQACTQCLGSLNGQAWLLAVAPPSEAAAPDLEQIQAFRIPHGCFIKLHLGTWHAGPYFDADTVDFYNLELSDTNVVDHDTCNLRSRFQMEFEIIAQNYSSSTR